MGKKRRTFTDKFKEQVAVDAIKGIKILVELATEYKIHPKYRWALDKRTPAEVFLEETITR